MEYRTDPDKITYKLSFEESKNFENTIGASEDCSLSFPTFKKFDKTHGKFEWKHKNLYYHHLAQNNEGSFK